MGGPALRRSFFTRAGLPTAKVTDSSAMAGGFKQMGLGLPEDGVSMGIVYIDLYSLYSLYSLYTVYPPSNERETGKPMITTYYNHKPLAFGQPIFRQTMDPV
jgi:hypothetical protein